MALPLSQITVWLAYVWLASGRDHERPLSVLGMAATGVGLVAATVAAVCVVRRVGQPEPGAVVSPTVFFVVLAALVFQPLPGDVVVLQTGPWHGSCLAFWSSTGVLTVSRPGVGLGRPTPLVLTHADGCLVRRCVDDAEQGVRSG